MSKSAFVLPLAMSITLGAATTSRADVRSKAAMEVAEQIARQFGKEAVKEGVEAFAKRVATAAGRHGDDVLSAVRKGGPRALHAVEEAGAHGGKMARLINAHGDDAVEWVASRPASMALLGKHGEQAGVALCKHKSIAEPLVEKLGEPAIEALVKVGPQSGRRLAIMAESGELAKIGRTDQLLSVVGKFGDKAASFVWEHKGSLVVASTLAAFLADPQPFIDGTVKLAEPIAEVPGKVVDSVVAPIVQAPVNAVANLSDNVGKRTNWTIILGLLSVLGGTLLVLRMLRRSQATQALGPTPDAPPPSKGGPPR